MQNIVGFLLSGVGAATLFAKRIQILNYGPIERVDIALPFEGESPKPSVIVGENGSGKSVLLSHIVNGLLSGKSVAYSETPEIQEGKVYKIRSDTYIKVGKKYYFGRVDFESGLYIEEFRTTIPKKDFSEIPLELKASSGGKFWDSMKANDKDHLANQFSSKREELKRLYAENCILYFPPNRFEEPAWLNMDDLIVEAQSMDLKRIEGHTSRRIINHSPLHSNRNWLFDVVYDRAVFELQTIPLPMSVPNGGSDIPVSVLSGYSGPASSVFATALSIVRSVVNRPDARFGIGRRQFRVVAVESDSGPIAPNIFNLSSGETSLLNLFLTILRDFDWCGVSFSDARDIRGIVIVDEIDLHLHSIHQYEILPKLMAMFPNVQFVVTTHSPLFVLGMQKTFGEEGFAIYELPHGQQIGPEEFREFGSAYQSFSESRMFRADLQRAIKESLKPIVFVEGDTDIKYIQRASELLGRQGTLSEIQLRDGNGYGGLNIVSKHFDSRLAEVTPQDIVLLYDCDKPNCSTKGNVHKRHIPLKTNHPLAKGIENLFSSDTLQGALRTKSAFIDVTNEYTRTIRGEHETVSEEWAINQDEKKNLCSWLCEHGSAEDFKHFRQIFDLLDELLELSSEADSMLEDEPVRNSVAQ